MSRPRILAAALFAASAAAVAPAAPVPAAKPADDPPVPPATARLLKYRNVQREVKMSAEQRIAMLDALEDNDEAFRKARDSKDSTVDDPYEEWEKGIPKVYADTAGKGLTPAQRARLRQIDLQLRGPAAFAVPAVQKGLDLTDAQKKAAADLAEKAKAQDERFLLTRREDTHREAKKKVVAFRADAVKKFTAGLTDGQQATWKAMLGDPVKGFDVDDLWLTIIIWAQVERDPDK